MNFVEDTYNWNPREDRGNWFGMWKISFQIDSRNR
jgi:sugar phosphate permease